MGASEEWRPIPGWDYEVSSMGRVRRLTTTLRATAGRVLSPVIYGRYPGVNLHTAGRHKILSVHRLVCVAFHGPPPTPLHEVAHTNGDRSDCRASNLRWATHAENQADMVLHGRSVRGGKNHFTRMSEEQVRLVRLAGSSGRSQRDVANEFGISQQHVSQIVTGKRWSHLK